ncbi:hypothetical protein X975_14869, partial [Stegodyphus mimosarum]
MASPRFATSTEISTGTQSGEGYADCGIRLDGVILTHAVPEGQTVNTDYYCRFLQHHLRPAMRRKRPHLLHNNLPIMTMLVAMSQTMSLFFCDGGSGKSWNTLPIHPT